MILLRQFDDERRLADVAARNHHEVSIPLARGVFAMCDILVLSPYICYREHARQGVLVVVGENARVLIMSLNHDFCHIYLLSVPDIWLYAMKTVPLQQHYYDDGMMKTERITLRPWLDTDAEALYKYAGDPEVGPRAGWSPHQSEQESLEIIHTVFNNPATWAIVWNETGEAIGAMGYGPSCDCSLPSREGEPTYREYKM